MDSNSSHGSHPPPNSHPRNNTRAESHTNPEDDDLSQQLLKQLQSVATFDVTLLFHSTFDPQRFIVDYLDTISTSDTPLSTLSPPHNHNNPPQQYDQFPLHKDTITLKHNKILNLQQELLSCVDLIKLYLIQVLHHKSDEFITIFTTIQNNIQQHVTPLVRVVKSVLSRVELVIHLLHDLVMVQPMSHVNEIYEKYYAMNELHLQMLYDDFGYYLEEQLLHNNLNTFFQDIFQSQDNVLKQFHLDCEKDKTHLYNYNQQNSKKNDNDDDNDKYYFHYLQKYTENYDIFSNTPSYYHFNHTIPFYENVIAPINQKLTQYSSVSSQLRIQIEKLQMIYDEEASNPQCNPQKLQQIEDKILMIQNKSQKIRKHLNIFENKLTSVIYPQFPYKSRISTPYYLYYSSVLQYHQAIIALFSSLLNKQESNDCGNVYSHNNTYNFDTKRDIMQICVVLTTFNKYFALNRLLSSKTQSSCDKAVEYTDITQYLSVINRLYVILALNLLRILLNCDIFSLFDPSVNNSDTIDDNTNETISTIQILLSVFLLNPSVNHSYHHKPKPNQTATEINTVFYLIHTLWYILSHIIEDLLLPQPAINSDQSDPITSFSLLFNPNITPGCLNFAQKNTQQQKATQLSTTTEYKSINEAFFCQYVLPSHITCKNESNPVTLHPLDFQIVPFIPLEQYTALYGQQISVCSLSSYTHEQSTSFRQSRLPSVYTKLLIGFQSVIDIIIILFRAYTDISDRNMDCLPDTLKNHANQHIPTQRYIAFSLLSIFNVFINSKVSAQSSQYDTLYPQPISTPPLAKEQYFLGLLHHLCVNYINYRLPNDPHNPDNFQYLVDYPLLTLETNEMEGSTQTYQLHPFVKKQEVYGNKMVDLLNNIVCNYPTQYTLYNHNTNNSNIKTPRDSNPFTPLTPQSLVSNPNKQSKQPVPPHKSSTFAYLQQKQSQGKDQLQAQIHAGTIDLVHAPPAPEKQCIDTVSPVFLSKLTIISHIFPPLPAQTVPQYFSLPMKPTSFFNLLLNNLSTITYSASLPYINTPLAAQQHVLSDLSTAHVILPRPHSNSTNISNLTHKHFDTLLTTNLHLTLNSCHIILMLCLNFIINMINPSIQQYIIKLIHLSTNYQQTPTFFNLMNSKQSGNKTSVDLFSALNTYIFPQLLPSPQFTYTCAENHLESFPNVIQQQYIGIFTYVKQLINLNIFLLTTGVTSKSIHINSSKNKYIISYSSTIINIMIAIYFNHYYQSTYNSLHLQLINILFIQTNNKDDNQAIFHRNCNIYRQFISQITNKFNPIAMLLLSTSITQFTMYICQAFTTLTQIYNDPITPNYDSDNSESPYNIQPLQYYSGLFQFYLILLRLPYKSPLFCNEGNIMYLSTDPNHTSLEQILSQFKQHYHQYVQHHVLPQYNNDQIKPGTPRQTIDEEEEEEELNDKNQNNLQYMKIDLFPASLQGIDNIMDLSPHIYTTFSTQVAPYPYSTTITSSNATTPKHSMNELSETFFNVYMLNHIPCHSHYFTLVHPLLYTTVINELMEYQQRKGFKTRVTSLNNIQNTYYFNYGAYMASLPPSTLFVISLYHYYTRCILFSRTMLKERCDNGDVLTNTLKVNFFITFNFLLENLIDFELINIYTLYCGIKNHVHKTDSERQIVQSSLKTESLIALSYHIFLMKQHLLVVIKPIYTALLERLR